MNACRRFRRELAAELEGSPSSGDRKHRKEHLAMCAECRKQWEDVETIIRGAGALQEEIREAVSAMDWESLSERIADEAAARRRTADIRSPDRRLFRPHWMISWRPVLAGALGGLLIGGAAVYFALRSPRAVSGPGLGIYASGEFIDRAELSVARRETLDYLAKSGALLLDFIQAPPEQAGRILREAPAARRAGDLLSKKRFLDAHLDDNQMAKARDICDQIERLFLELSQISEEQTAEEIERIQRFVEDRKILFRIKLLQRELQESEV